MSLNKYLVMVVKLMVICDIADVVTYMSGMFMIWQMGLIRYNAMVAACTSPLLIEKKYLRLRYMNVKKKCLLMKRIVT